MRRMLKSLGSAALLLLSVSALPEAASAQAASRADVSAVRRVLAREPSARDTVDAALRYFRVSPDAVDALRTAARARAALPLVAGGYRYDDTGTARTSQQTPSPLNQDENTATTGHSASIGAIWDFREFVFNPGEVQAYGVVGVQRDLILEVTRTFFMRRQLILRLHLRPPTDEVARITLEMRIEELTAILDSLTGGWFATELVSSHE